jgi:hypothetical protein
MTISDIGLAKSWAANNADKEIKEDQK